MRRIWMPLCLLIGVTVGALAQGPLTPIGQLQGRTDSNGALMVFGSAEALPQTPLTPIANLRGRTDSNGALYVTLTGGTGACSLGVTQVAFGDATTAACVGDSGFTYNQTQNAVTLSGALAPTGVGGQLAVLYMDSTVTPSANTNAKYGTYLYLEKPSGNAFNISGGLTGAYAEAFVKGTGTVQGIFGADAEAHLSSAATISTDMWGTYTEAVISGGAGNVTNQIIGLEAYAEHSGTGTVGGIIGGRFTGVGTGGTTTNPFTEGLDVTATDSNGHTTNVYGIAFSARGRTANVYGLNGGAGSTSNLSGVLTGAYLTADTGVTDTITGGITGVDVFARTQSSNSNQTIGVNIVATDTGSASPTIYGLKSNVTGSGTLYGIYSDGDATLQNYILGASEASGSLIIGTQTMSGWGADLEGTVLAVTGGLAPTVGHNTTFIDFEPGADAARTIPVGKDFVGMYVNPTITTAASGTHANLTNVYFYQGVQTSGGATITNASNVVIDGAPTIGTNNYALHVINGVTSAFHITGNGSTPAVTDTSANSCGTGTQTITGNDNAGKVTVIGSAGTSCTVTFATAFANAPACSASNETTAALARATSTQTTVILAGSFSQNDVIAYVCVGK